MDWRLLQAWSSKDTNIVIAKIFVEIEEEVEPNIISPVIEWCFDFHSWWQMDAAADTRRHQSGLQATMTW